MILLKCNPANCHSPLYINGFGDKKAERLFYQNKRSAVARLGYMDTMQPSSVKLCTIWQTFAQ